MLIYLIGMPASGKSETARKLSHQLGMPYIDLDKKIEQEAGTDIGTMFWLKGEEYFRIWERTTLQQTSTLDNVIISTGGGTPCHFDNIQWILQHGISFFLNTPLQVIAHRLYHGKKRPMFEGLNMDQVLEKVQQLYEQRSPYYTQAHHSLASHSTQQYVDEIVELL